MQQCVVLVTQSFFFVLIIAFLFQNVPATFGEICLKLFDGLTQTGNIILSTDLYVPGPIKSMERRRRGCAEKLIIGGPATKRPTEWKLFLNNDDSKIQFVRLVLKLWTSDEHATRLHGCVVLLICEGVTYLLTSDDGITTKKTELPVLHSSPEETDSRVV